MDLGTLIQGLNLQIAGDNAQHTRDIRVCDLTEDSRTVVPGSLFIARKGLKSDGHQYIEQAIRDGAVAILTDKLPESTRLPRRAGLILGDDLPTLTAALAERFYHNPSTKLSLVGVTGTNGKTTIAHIVHKLLNRAGLRTGLISTVQIDDGTSIEPASMTTPPAIELSRTLAMMVEGGCEAAAIEVSSHALDQHRPSALRFDAAIFTNLSGDHQDYHPSMEDYLASKQRLFSLLKPEGVAITNIDDPAGERIVENCSAHIIRCSLTQPADATAKTISTSLSATRILLQGPWGSIEATIHLPGKHNITNALQAACAAHVIGLGPEAIAEGLTSIRPPRGRLQPVTTPRDDITVLIDYAHTDDALAKTLTSVRDSMDANHKRLIVVFGCGGNRDTTKRPRMGSVAASLADLVWITSDNPRTERPKAIVDEILTGISKSRRSQINIQIDRAKAIEEAIEAAETGDVIVIAGKGHETEQILPDGNGDTISRHFDDAEHAREALTRRRTQTAPAGGAT